MPNTDQKYESYRLQWMLSNGICLNKALQNAVSIAVRVSQAVTVLSNMGIEPGDMGNPAPANLGAGLWHINTNAQDIIVQILSPMLDGVKEPGDAVDRAVCVVAENRLKTDTNGTDGELVDEFMKALRPIIDEDFPDIVELAGQIIDFMEDNIKTEKKKVSKASRDAKNDNDAIMTGGLYDAVRDTISAIIRKALLDTAEAPDVNALANAVLHAASQTCYTYGLKDSHMLNPCETGPYLRSTFENWKVELTDAWSRMHDKTTRQ